MIPVNELFNEIMKPSKPTIGIIINGVVTRITLAIILAFFATFIHDYLDGINAFGDYIAEKHYSRGGLTDIEIGDEIWGARHHWYLWGCVFIFAGWIAKIFNYIFIKSNKL